MPISGYWHKQTCALVGGLIQPISLETEAVGWAGAVGCTSSQGLITGQAGSLTRVGCLSNKNNGTDLNTRVSYMSFHMKLRTNKIYLLINIWRLIIVRDGWMQFSIDSNIWIKMKNYCKWLVCRSLHLTQVLLLSCSK